jgi:hypothetical protein
LSICVTFTVTDVAKMLLRHLARERFCDVNRCVPFATLLTQQ